LKSEHRNQGEGRLPANAPLANAYVPFQMDNPPRYEAAKGLVRGTLYPGLELPFMGMVNSERNMTPKMQMQALAFAIQELALYLDTHRDDKEAVELYQNYQRIYHECMVTYSKENGPLNHMMPTNGPYAWLDDPWPWEYSGNREV
jgi:spore coat protein JB